MLELINFYLTIVIWLEVLDFYFLCFNRGGVNFFRLFVVVFRFWVIITVVRIGFIKGREGVRV